jgi:lipopolysaccharide transport system ATP-binding protein
MSSEDIAIRVNNLSKRFEIYDEPRDRLKQFVLPRLQSLAGQTSKQYYREFWALKDVSFEIKKGETVGIIGRNGSGKSTLLQMICGTLNPTSGSIQTNGRIAALLELGSGFNPEFSGRENVYMNASVLGLSNEEIDARYDDIAAFADIGDFIKRPVKTYSSGMMVRLAFSVAIHVDPNILIVDEALSVGDAYFQAKCANMIQSIISKGATVLFVSHDTASVKSLCNRALLLDSGHSQFMGDVNTVVEKYYSALVASQGVKKKPEFQKDNNSLNPIEWNSDDKKFKSIASFQRIQNGSAEFINIMVLDENGRSIDTLTFGQKVTLRQIIKINSPMPKLGLAYHIRDKNGQDIVYSDTGIESDSHILQADGGSIYVVDWSFTAHLREGNYVISSMASEPVNLQAGNVVVVDFIPISARFSISRGQGLPIYAAVYWKNDLHVREIKHVE